MVIIQDFKMKSLEFEIPLAFIRNNIHNLNPACSGRAFENELTVGERHTLNQHVKKTQNLVNCKHDKTP